MVSPESVTQIGRPHAEHRVTMNPEKNIPFLVGTGTPAASMDASFSIQGLEKRNKKDDGANTDDPFPAAKIGEAAASVAIHAAQEGAPLVDETAGLGTEPLVADQPPTGHALIVGGLAMSYVKAPTGAEQQPVAA